MRSFLDTNVLVYLFDRSDPAKQARAREVVREGAGGDEDYVVSTQVLLEFYAVVTSKLEPPLAHDTAVRVVERLSALPVVAPSPGMVVEAMQFAHEHVLSIWDALIVRAARAAICDRILTEDLADGSVLGGVRVENPFLGLH